ALLEQRRQRALIFDAQRVGSGQHRAPVVADAGAVARRAGVVELGLPAPGVLCRCAGRPRADHEHREHERWTMAAHDRMPPRIERKFAGQTPARPGEMMPFGSMASFNCSVKRRSTKSLNEYWSATSSCRIGGAR